MGAKSKPYCQTYWGSFTYFQFQKAYKHWQSLTAELSSMLCKVASKAKYQATDVCMFRMLLQPFYMKCAIVTHYISWNSHLFFAKIKFQYFHWYMKASRQGAITMISQVCSILVTTCVRLYDISFEGMSTTVTMSYQTTLSVSFHVVLWLVTSKTWVVDAVTLRICTKISVNLVLNQFGLTSTDLPHFSHHQLTLICDGYNYRV